MLSRFCVRVTLRDAFSIGTYRLMGCMQDLHGKLMIKHIVRWKLKKYAEGAQCADNALAMKAKLDACSDLIPNVLKFETALACSKSSKFR